MTNDILLDTDIEFSNGVVEHEPETDTNDTAYTGSLLDEHLNEAYERVSSNGSLPDLSEYGFSETGREIDDPFSNQGMYDYETSAHDGYESELGGAFAYNDEQSQDENNENSDEDDQDLTLIQMINSKHVPFNKLMGKIVKPVLFFVVASVIVTSFNRIVEQDLTDIAKLTKQLENIKGQSILISNELARFCKSSEVAERVETQALGIHSLKEPPQYFVVTKYNRPDSLKDERELFIKHWKQLQKQQQATTTR